MEKLFNIHNIDDTHVSDHHNQEDFTYEHPSVDSMYKIAKDRYEQEMLVYNKLSWFKKLFTPKPTFDI